MFRISCGSKIDRGQVVADIKRTPWRTEKTRQASKAAITINEPTYSTPFYQRYPALTVHHHRDLLEWIGVESWNRASDVHFLPTDTLADLPHCQLLLQCVAYKFLLLLFLIHAAMCLVMPHVQRALVLAFCRLSCHCPSATGSSPHLCLFCHRGTFVRSNSDLFSKTNVSFAVSFVDSLQCKVLFSRTFPRHP